MLRLSLALISLAAAEKPPELFTLSVSDDHIAVGTTVEVTVEYEGEDEQKVADPLLPDGLLEISRSTSHNVQIVGGRATRRAALSLRVRAVTAGKWVIRGPRMNAVKVFVDSELSPPPTPVVRWEIRVVPERPFPGQAVAIHVAAVSESGDLASARLSEIQRSGGLLWLAGDYRAQGLLRPRGARWGLGSVVYMAVGPGTVTFGPLKGRATVKGATREVDVYAPARQIEVRPLPAGRPAGYRDGSVGQFQVRSQLAEVGGATVLRVEVHGAGNLWALSPPTLGPSDGWAVGSGPRHGKIEASPVTQRGHRVFEWTLVGKGPAPPVNLRWLDPIASQWR